jgi:2-dehydro-3-deoxygluconokinase
MIVCFGEMLLRLATAPGVPLVDTPSLGLVVGGAEANVAAALAALGWPTRMATVLPGNPLGDRALAALGAWGVDTRHVRRAAGRMGLYVLETGASLRASVITYDRAGSAFALADPAAFDFDAMLDGARLLHLSGITAALGPNGLDLCRAAIAAANRLGVPVSFDPNYRDSLWSAWDSDPRAALHELIGGAHVLFAGHRDMTLVLGRDVAAGRAAAEAAFAAFPRLQVMASTTRQTITAAHNRLSARVDSGDDHHCTDDIAIPEIVDRIGSGDAFAAGVLHAWLRGESVAAMARAGLALGAIKHAIHGDTCRVTQAELDGFDGTGGDVRR